MSESIPEFKKTILVGLGGAGKLILTHLKRLLIDEYGVVPPCIKLLSLDTDFAPVSVRSALSEKEYSLDDKEFLHMKVDQPVEFIKNSSVNNWFTKPLPAGSISKGAGAIRQVGRVALFYHINEFQRRFDDLLTQLTANELYTKMVNAKDDLPGANTNFKLSNSDPEIYICGSLAGGTGSGTFLDVGIFLRDQFPEALIHGYFLLNWIYRNKAFAYRVPCNVYAALSELDYIQSIVFGAKDFDPYKIHYAEKEVEVEKPPFNLVNLIDGRNEYGENIHEVGNLCETTANAIFLAVGSLGDAVASVVDNLLSHINSSPPGIWNGKYARYSSFGVSSIYYPAIELHKLISADNAHKLCSMAVAEVEGAARNPDAASRKTESIQLDVNNSLGQNALNVLNRDFVRDKVCPFQAPIAFPVQPFFISDKGFPAMIDHQFQQEKKNLMNKLDLAWEENGKQFIQNTIMTLGLKIDEMTKSAEFDQAYLKGWIDEAVDLLTAQENEVTRVVNTETENVNNHLENTSQLKEISVKSRHIPMVGGARKKAVGDWAAAITTYFTSIKNLHRFECEKKFYGQILDFLRSQKPGTVDSASNVLTVLNSALQALRGMVRRERENLKILKSKSNQILIGNGNTVIVPGEDNVSFLNTIDCDYEEFMTENGINNPEDFLTISENDPDKLKNIFIGHCMNKLNYIKDFSLQEAMDTIGEKKGNKDEYVKEQISHLFRLASALWSFNRSKLSEIQHLQYDKIVNLGVYDKVAGEKNYNQAVTDVKGKYGIRADHSFSTTGDKYRIWIVNFAAALPVCYLSDLKQSRKKYENEISPTYHIDKRFEMNVPDLFPMNNVANRALRVLGMTIVPGIDVIFDEKLSKGHKFIFDDPEFTEINLGEPKIWYLFRDMYDEVVDSFDPENAGNLLDILSKRLTEKVNSMEPAQLKDVLNTYLDKVKEKLKDRDFSRLISARLTYREVKELENFLDPKRYAMDMDRYISGKF